ncbi:MAG: protein kinase, partial [Pseudonocardia sp.]
MSAGLQLDEIEAEFRRRRIARFAPATLLWLAALPEWTDQRAAAVGFPPGDESLDVLLDRLDAVGLLARRIDVDRDGRLLSAFWLPASRRAEVGTHLRSERTPGQLRNGLRELARALAGLPGEHGEDMRPWLAVVERHLDDPSGLTLFTEVDALVTSGRSADALGVVSAAQALGDVLGEPLVSSARRAQWRIDRGHRQALDARTVAHYLPHPQVDEALLRLLDPDGGAWAVHLLGDGGVGKTMAVRDLASGRFAARHGLAHPAVARIDFDHLDPRYPYGRPGELLLALVGELFTYSATREAESAFRASDDALAHLHESMAAPDALDTRLLDEAVEAFAGYLVDLGGLVVLVLDTCEELAKLHPPGGRAPAVDRTFELLERLHEQAPTMRVVLAGRRWLVPPPGGRSSGGLVLDPRPYLEVVGLGGFSDAQAREYLDRRDPGATLNPQLRDAVLARCTPPSGRGVNPYDLACYCDWALGAPDLDPEALRDAPGDPYVEQRILARLPSSEVRDCLPAAVELGRFDRTMIEAALVRRGIDVDTAFSGLVGQEWVSAVSFDADGRPDVVEIDEQLRPRLSAVLAAHPERFPLDTGALAADLHTLIEATPVPELAVEAVEAALRLLPVGGAAALWRDLESRIAAADGGFDWALQAVARAAGVEAVRAAGDGPTVQAAILATQAAAQLRLPGPAVLGPLWRQVGALAARHPDPEAARVLEFRALCGRVAAGENDAGVTGRIRALWAEHRDGLPLDSLLAALDAAPDEVLDRLPLPDDGILAETPAEIVAAVLLVRARASALRGKIDDAVAAADRALADPGDDAPADRWPDWRPPLRPRDRARLARVVLAVARGDAPDTLPVQQWRSEALPRVADIDAERLVAATLTLELAWRPVARDAVAAAKVADVYLPQRGPTQWWHRRTPPLCLAVARGLAADGDAPGAADWLRRRREDAVAAGEDPSTISLCERELAELSRVFRSLSFSTSILHSARAGTASDAVWPALALVRGESPRSPEQAGGAQSWWRTRIVGDGPGPDVAVLPSAGSTLAEWLDLLEAAILQGDRTAGVQREAALRYERLVQRPPRPLLGEPSAVAALLRAGALLNPSPQVPDVVIALPPRLRGEIAMAEGELLALRLPANACTLLEQAVDAFRLAGDEQAAARAAILHVLTASRAGHGWPGLRRIGPLVKTPLPDQPEWSGWPDRRDLARRLVAGEWPTAPADPSPELALAARPQPATPVAAGHASRPALEPEGRRGSRFGPYRLEELLDRNDTGEIYRAHDTAADRVVALKLLRTELGEDPYYRARFERELLVVARLNEPHVIPVHRWGEIDGRLFLDMRHVEGANLDEVIDRAGPLPPHDAVEVIAQVGQALDAAHDEGIAHRDVKPATVRLAEAGRSTTFAYLTGFGVARALSDDSAVGLTMAGSAVGTLDYTAPERFSGKDADRRADVYSLACVLYEALTGERPYPVDGLAALMFAHLRTPPPRPSEHGAPVAFDEVIAKGMAKDPQDRYPTAGALATAARNALALGSRPQARAAGVATPPSAPDPHPLVLPPAAGHEPGYPQQWSLPTGAPAAPGGPPAFRAPPSPAPRGRRTWPVVVAAALVLAGALAAALGASLTMERAASPVGMVVEHQPATSTTTPPSPTGSPTVRPTVSPTSAPAFVATAAVGAVPTRPPTRPPVPPPTTGPTTPVAQPGPLTGGGVVVLVLAAVLIAGGIGLAVWRRLPRGAHTQNAPQRPSTRPSTPPSPRPIWERPGADGSVPSTSAGRADPFAPAAPPEQGTTDQRVYGVVDRGTDVLLVREQAGTRGYRVVATVDGEPGVGPASHLLVRVQLPRLTRQVLRWRLPVARQGRARLEFRGPAQMR